MVETNNRPALVFWFTGLSGSGKSSIAQAARGTLIAQNVNVLVLDGDDVRRKHNVKLGFSRDDIIKNNRHITDFCIKTRHDYDAIFVSVISPLIENRAAAREDLSPGFFEIFIDANLTVVTQRDTKGLYKKARQNKITNMVGFHDSSPYEKPLNPDLKISTGRVSEAKCADIFIKFALDQLSVFSDGTDR